MHLLLLALACSEYTVVAETTVGPVTTDETTWYPPTTGGSTGTTSTSTTATVPDCAVAVSTDGTVATLEECEGGPVIGPVSDPWNLAVEYQYTVSGGSVCMPAVGNLTDDNGDGRVNEKDVPDIVISTYGSGKLIALSGDYSGLLWEASGFRSDGCPVIADIDGDGEPEVVAPTSSSKVRALDGDGNLEWESTDTFSLLYPVTTVADLDADGDPEVIADAAIVEGATGRKIAQLNPGNSYWRAPIAADIDRDGQQEVILSNGVFDNAGNLQWSAAGSGIACFGAVANFDADKEAEVVFAFGSELKVYEHDGTKVQEFSIPGNYDHPGPPCVADFDGDGEPEIAVPAGSAISVYEWDGTQLWTSTINDSSGAAGCSAYDMDGDSVYELLFADQNYLRIYDGKSGTIQYEDPNHGSVTYFEYPVVADLDLDGSAEIVVTDSAGIYGVTVFGHRGDGWPKSGPTWAVHDFAATNVDPDGSIPRVPEESWLKYNIFRARPAVDDPSAADLMVSLTDLCVASCVDPGPVKISFQVSNRGGDLVEAGEPWTVFRIDGTVYTVVASGTLPEVPEGVALPGIVVELQPSQLGTDGFAIGAGVDANLGVTISECDPTNNTLVWGDRICQ